MNDNINNDDNNNNKYNTDHPPRNSWKEKFLDADDDSTITTVVQSNKTIDVDDSEFELAVMANEDEVADEDDDEDPDNIPFVQLFEQKKRLSEEILPDNKVQVKSDEADEADEEEYMNVKFKKTRFDVLIAQSIRNRKMVLKQLEEKKRLNMIREHNGKLRTVASLLRGNIPNKRNEPRKWFDMEMQDRNVQIAKE